jgi:hypothetical protein
LTIKSVATKADVKTRNGDVSSNKADPGTGQWDADTSSIQVKTDPNVTIGGQPAIVEASCTFNFSNGTKQVGNTKETGKTDSETVTLKASELGSTVLQGGENQVLRDGDSKKSDQYHNEVYISSSGVLRSG